MRSRNYRVICDNEFVEPFVTFRLNPYPAKSSSLDFAWQIGEPRRLRIEQWRIIYAVIDHEIKIVAVLAVRRRPPYDYQDIEELFLTLDYG